MVFHVAIKYILHMHDLRTAQNWEAKTVYLLYAELVMSEFYILLFFTFLFRFCSLYAVWTLCSSNDEASYIPPLLHKAFLSVRQVQLIFFDL